MHLVKSVSAYATKAESWRLQEGFWESRSFTSTCDFRGQSERRIANKRATSETRAALRSSVRYPDVVALIAFAL